MSTAIAVILVVAVAVAPMRASRAWAECAWVLWGESNDEFQFFVSATQTKRECEQALEKKTADDIRYLTKDKGTTVTTDDVTGRRRLWIRHTTKTGSTDLTVTTYVCVPDTINPQTLKGYRQ